MNADKIQEKLKQFESEIQAKVREEKEKVQEEVNAFKYTEMAKYTDTALADTYEIIQKEVSQQQVVLNKAGSEKIVERKRELFRRREEYTKSVFESVRQKLVEYTKSEDYPNYLICTAQALGKEVPSENGNVLLMRQEDIYMTKELAIAFGKPCEIKATTELELGGLILENSEMGYVENRSMDSALEEQYRWFCDHSGMTVEF